MKGKTEFKVEGHLIKERRGQMKMKKVISTILLLALIAPIAYSQNLTQEVFSDITMQETDVKNHSLFYRHSLQFNAAGLGFERWGMAYELRMTPRHAIFVQGGGSFPFISEEKEYGFGLHYKYFLQPASDARFLWLIKSSYRNTFLDFNIRYMNLDGIHNGAGCLYESYFIGAGIGQTWVWNSGFTISYWLGYGPPVKGEYKWKNNVPANGDSWARTYKNSSGLDFGLSFGYSFGGRKNR